MKKTLIAVLALAAAAACNKAEVVEQNPTNAIAFENVFVDNAVKSVVDPSYKDGNMFSDFAVYGFVEGATLFNGNTVSQKITNNDLTNYTWKYEGTQYWIAGANYNFCAIAPKTNGGWTSVTSAQNTTDYTVNTSFSFTNNGVTDLLYADSGKKMGAVSGNDVVEFTFRHLLSKVKFSFKNGYNASNATIKVSKVKITNAHKTGDVDLTAAATTWTNLQSSLELDFGSAVNDEDNVADAYAYNTTLESYNELFLIPSATYSYTITFHVDLLVNGTSIGEGYNHEVTVEFAPEAGHAYDINAEITASNIDPEHAQEPIEFTVAALPGWGTASDVNATVNNKNN